MKYMSDVYYNFFNETNPHLVPYFHEWDKNDKVDLIGQIPLLKVNKDLYNYIEFGLKKIPKEILSVVFNKSFERVNNDRVLLKYVFVATDGERVMVFQGNEDGRVEKKSRLIPRQHLLALELIDNEEVDYILESKVDVTKFNVFAGKTRQEKRNQIIATEFINKLLPDHLGLLKYLVSEFDTNLHKKLTGAFDDIKHRFLEEIKGSEITRLIEFNKAIKKIKIS